MAAKRYRVTLTEVEREALAGLLPRGKADVRRLKHAQVLLKADASEAGPGWPDVRIAEAVAVGVATVERVRRRFVEEGFEAALSPCRGGKRVYARKFDGEGEAHLVALACSAPPEGRGRWTLRLLASRMVELEHTDRVSHETVRRTLKKERAASAPAADVVHSAQALRRVRVPRRTKRFAGHGRRAGGVLPPV